MTEPYRSQTGSKGHLAPASVDPELLHLLPEVLAGDGEDLGGLGAVAVGRAEDAADVGALGVANDLAEGDERAALLLLEEALLLAAERALEEQLARERPRGARECDRPLDGVLELADVAGPAVR